MLDLLEVPRNCILYSELVHFLQTLSPMYLLTQNIEVYFLL